MRLSKTLPIYDNAPLERRLSMAETAITQTSKEIALKASQSDMNLVNGRMTNLAGELSVQAGQIAAKVSRDGIIASINASVEEEGGSAVTINASKITLDAGSIRDTLEGSSVKIYAENIELKGAYVAEALNESSVKVEASKIQLRAPSAGVPGLDLDANGLATLINDASSTITIGADHIALGGSDIADRINDAAQDVSISANCINLNGLNDALRDANVRISSNHIQLIADDVSRAINNSSILIQASKIQLRAPESGQQALALNDEGIVQLINDSPSEITLSADKLSFSGTHIQIGLDNLDISGEDVAGLVNHIDDPTVKIQASKINLSGYVTITSLETPGSGTTINGGNITTGTIRGVSIIVGGQNNGDGTLELYNNSGQKEVTLDKAGLTAYLGGNAVSRLGGSNYANISSDINGKYAAVIVPTGVSGFEVVSEGQSPYPRLRLNASDGMIGVYNATLRQKRTIIGDAELDMYEANANNYLAVHLDRYGIQAYNYGHTTYKIYSRTTASGEQGLQLYEWANNSERLSAQYSSSGITLYSAGSASTILTASRLMVGGSLYIYGGNKHKLVDTESYDRRLLACYETPTPMFGDIGEGTVGDDGKCYVQIDPIFASTVSLNQYQVSLQQYGEGDLWISDRQMSHFVVEGTPGLDFGWELKAKQIDADQLRLETFSLFEYEEDKSYDYGGELEYHIIDSEEDLMAGFANQYDTAMNSSTYGADLEAHINEIAHERMVA